jgi:hypothetical protein
MNLSLSPRFALISAVAGVAIALLAACSGSVVVEPNVYGEPIPNTNNGSSCSFPVSRSKGNVAPACANAPTANGVAPACAAPPVADSYPLGKEFDSPDGCNTCVCTSQGIACTKRACSKDVCVHNKIVRSVGEKWSISDDVPVASGNAGAAAPTGDRIIPVEICGKQSSSGSSGASGSTSGGSSGGSSSGSCECLAGGVIACSVSAVPAKPSRPAEAAPIAPQADCLCESPSGLVPVGTKFNNDCNTCVCTVSGVSCTEIACAPKTCDYQGKKLQIGETAFDGCNSCACMETREGAALTCTANFCGDAGGPSDGGASDAGPRP